MRLTLRHGGTAAAVFCALAATASASTPVTPAGWRVSPAGSEIAIERSQPGMQGPLGAALSPDGGRLLVSSSGAAKIESADLFDLGQGMRTSYVPYDAANGGSMFYGVAFSPDGTKDWASGGGQQVVHSYTVSSGQLTAGPDISTRRGRSTTRPASGRHSARTTSRTSHSPISRAPRRCRATR